MTATWNGTIDLLAGQSARATVQFSIPTYPADSDGTFEVQPLGISEIVGFREDRIHAAETTDDRIAGIALAGARVSGEYKGEMHITFVANTDTPCQVKVSLTGAAIITLATLTPM